MNFESGMKMKSTIKKESLKNPKFGKEIIDAIEQSLKDGKERVVGNIVEKS